ncbi:hypothetical protein AHMF7605_27380 [Adhaeribacter arboris]|uniref:DUF4595 domain-containing protein n=1 Tax=Adhaeribacter arboris TaxID=2072846 RepID=A0A2T2YN74_9BACT|nr:hypothetical protein [Adhaeribacter arboris]PSR56951.1 hypothetical protein AHMF7605_27380 [Adhaeribacter arboris]
MKKPVKFSLLPKAAIVFAIACTTLITACRDEVIAPATRSDNPGNSNPNENSGQLWKGKTVQLKWSALDFQKLEYNPAGQLIRYTSQYNSVQGTDQVTKFIQQFDYDAQNRLVKKIAIGDGLITYYSYNGPVLEKATEYNLIGKPLVEYVFTFNNQQQLITQVKFFFETDDQKREQEKSTYRYDERGNLNEVGLYYKDPVTQQFKLTSVFHFSDFDDKVNVIPYLNSPYLPHIPFWKNNPGSKKVENVTTGAFSAEESYTYVYHENGLPNKRITKAEVGQDRTFTYEGEFLYTETK